MYFGYRRAQQMGAYLGALATVAALLANGAGAATARNVYGETFEPVVMDDDVTIGAYRISIVDVLANDTDPQGAHLDICKIKASPLPRGAVVEILQEGEASDYPVDGDVPSSDSIFIYVDRLRTSETLHITYFACNDEFLTPGILKVNLHKPKPVTGVRVAPGVVRWTNDNNFAVRISCGRKVGGDLQAAGSVRVPIRGSVHERVGRKRLDYVAFNPRRELFVNRGTVRAYSVHGTTVFSATG